MSNKTQKTILRAHLVNATVKVMSGTTPMEGAVARLIATLSTNIQITPATATTDANGIAKFTITLTSDFTQDTTVSIEPRATINGIEYTGASTTLTIKSSVTPPTYDVTMTLEKTQIEGKKDNTVKATIIVKYNGLSVANITVTVSLSPSAWLSASNATTDTEGKAEVSITVTEDITSDITVKVIPKVAGVEYQDKAVNLTITKVQTPPPAPTTTTPGFEFLVVIAAIALVAGISAYSRMKEH